MCVCDPERDRESVRCKRTTSIVKRHDLVVRIHASPICIFGGCCFVSDIVV